MVCGRPRRKGKEGKGKERKGKERKGRERNEWEKKTLEISELGCADGCGRRGCKGGWKWVGRRSRWRSASVAARTAADGKWVRRIARTAADVGAREWLEMGGKKKPLVMSELGCADGCGREMGAEDCADGCGWRGCKGVAGNGWGEEAAGDERAWRADGCGREMVRNCADGCGRRGCKGVAGNGLGGEAAVDERAWLRGRLRTGNGCGEVRGQLRTAWVQRRRWKWVGRRSRW